MPRRLSPLSVFAIVLFGALLALGLALWLPEAGASSGTADSELGAAILGGTIIAVVVFLVERRSQSEQSGRAIAQALIAEATTPEFFAGLTLAGEQLGPRSTKEQDERWESWQRMPPAERLKLIQPLNVIEQIGAAYVAREADRAVLQRYLQDVVPEVWARLQWFVGRLRTETGNPEIFGNFEKMSAGFQKIRERQKQPVPYPDPREARTDTDDR
jgi:hypothetical protein